MVKFIEPSTINQSSLSSLHFVTVDTLLILDDTKSSLELFGTSTNQQNCVNRFNTTAAFSGVIPSIL